VAQIAPDSVSLEWEGRRIDLYPTLTPAENAQAYFRRYADARDAKRVVPPLIEETSRELEYLDEMALHVEMADSERDLNTLRRELEATGVLREARGKSKQRDSQRARGKPPTGLYRRFSVDGNEILAGTSAVGNEMVTFGVAGPNDLWFHVRGGPGAHVILRNPGRDPSPQIIEAAARLAAAHSALREELRADVVYTPRRHVRKIAGAAPGQVTYRGETTVSVRPEMDKRAAAARSA
jgi:predicted ribosome quality control (RQC) complex YloA/Tae2 family protein